MKMKTCLPRLVVLVAQLSFAQAPPAPSVAEKVTRDWLAAFNSGDKGTLQAFLEKYRPSGVPHVDDLIDFYSRTGGFDFEKVEESTPTHCAALVKEKDSDQFARLVIDIEPDPPHKITKFELLVTARPAEFAIPRMGQKEAVDALGKQLERDTQVELESLPSGTWRDGVDLVHFKAAAKQAVEEAAKLGHNYVGSEHLVLALTRDASDSVRRIFRKHGLSAEKYTEAVRSVLG